MLPVDERLTRLEARVEYCQRAADRIYWLFVILSLIPVGLVVGIFYAAISQWIAG